MPHQASVLWFLYLSKQNLLPHVSHPIRQNNVFFLFKHLLHLPLLILQANVQSERFLLEWHVDGIRSRWSSSSPLRCKTEAVWNMDGYPQFAFKYTHSQSLHPDKTTTDTAPCIALGTYKSHGFFVLPNGCDNVPFLMKDRFATTERFHFGLLSF